MHCTHEHTTSAALDVAALYRKHRRLVRYQFAATGVPHCDVDDLAQDTALHAWQYRHSYNAELGASPDTRYLRHATRSAMTARNRSRAEWQRADESGFDDYLAPDDDGETAALDHAIAGVSSDDPELAYRTKAFLLAVVAALTDYERSVLETVVTVSGLQGLKRGYGNDDEQQRACEMLGVTSWHTLRKPLYRIQATFAAAWPDHFDATI
jgi:DNA-directed RNA polymerase specialized sigma24 family protein